MNVRPKTDLYLMHMETGQRYPLAETEILIGRLSADIIYPQDPGLSSQHCRICTTDQGLAIHDLNSQTGTWIDEQRIEPGKLYPLRVGTVIRIGEQELKVHDASLARKKLTTRKRRKKQKQRIDYFSLLAGALILAGLSFVTHTLLKPTKSLKGPLESKILSPLDLVEKEVQAAFEDYRQLGSAFKSGALSDQEAAKKIRRTLLPAFQAAQLKLDVVKPESEFDRRKTELNIKLLKALSAQMTAFVMLIETKDAKFAKDMERSAEESELLRQQISDLKRQPAANN